jgi:aminoglycoside/choline kinase family phosphotransferase
MIEQPKRSFDFIAIQRQLKAIGIFARLHLRDHKSSHLAHILPVLQRLVVLTGEYPELALLNMQLKSCVEPAATRLAPL